MPERRAFRQELQSSAERPHRFWPSAGVHVCMKKLWKAGERATQRSRQNNPWSSHQAGNSLFTPVRAEKPYHIMGIDRILKRVFSE